MLIGGPEIVARDPTRSLDKAHLIQSSPLEREITDSSEQFSYDFVKAICVWLDSGPSALAESFAGQRTRRPLSAAPSVDEIKDKLIPYLLSLASDRFIPNVDASRFEVDENRLAFHSEKAAVLAFASAVTIPFTDLMTDVVSTNTSLHQSGRYESYPRQDRSVALRYWGFKIARGVLMNAGEGINFAFAERAFGGLGKTPPEVREEENALARQTEEIIADDDDPPIAAIGTRRKHRKTRTEPPHEVESREDRARRIRDRVMGRPSSDSRPQNAIVEDADDTDEDMISIDDVGASIEAITGQNGLAEENVNQAAALSDADVEDDDYGEDDDDDMVSSSSETSEGEDEDGDDDPMTRNFLLRPSFARSSLRHKCNRQVPGVGAQLHYEGAANVRTVKDVNFYGLNDEYVVSGSDSGHLFIWDRASGRLLNILEGDGEVVNVVQGHPYEPMLAVSGIDHTVKIFSSDKQARDSARRGLRLNNTGYSGFSTLGMGGRTRFGRARRPPPPPTRNVSSKGEEESLLSSSEPAVLDPTSNESDTESEEAVIAPNGLSSRKRMHLRAQITSENDVERRGGHGRETFITRGMLAQLAAGFRMRQAGLGVGGGEGGEDDDEGGDQVIEIDGENLVIQGGRGDCAVQ